MCPRSTGLGCLSGPFPPGPRWKGRNTEGAIAHLASRVGESPGTSYELVSQEGAKRAKSSCITLGMGHVGTDHGGSWDGFLEGRATSAVLLGDRGDPIGPPVSNG